MKKVIIELFLLVVLAVVSSIIIYDKFGKTEKIIITEDENKLKQEYEVLNNNRETKYVKVNIPEDNNVIYIDNTKLKEILKGDTGIVIFASSKDNASRNAMEIILNSASSNDVENIYYYDMTDIRDEKELNSDNEVIINKEGTKEYKELLEILSPYIGAYDGLNDPSIKRIYLPTVLFVVDGKVGNIQIGLIDSIKDSDKPLRKEEKDELAKIYMKYMIDVASGVCDEKC